MQTLEIDQYSRRSTFFSFDPRAKLVGTVALVVALSFLRDLAALTLAAIFLAILLILSRIPFRHIGRIFSLSLPFILVAAVVMYFVSGATPALALALRIGSSVLAILLLITTTPFFDFLWALRWFRVPYVLCSLLLFTYRYIFVMLEELDSMRMARRSRGFSMKGSLLSKDVFRTLSYTAGMLLVRSYERSKDIYNGLISRGFSGEIRIIRKPAIRAKDVALVTAFAVVIVAMVSIQWGVMPWMA